MGFISARFSIEVEEARANQSLPNHLLLANPNPNQEIVTHCP